MASTKQVHIIMIDIEIGRFAGVARDCRLCKFCSLNQVESEYHFPFC